jgi:hypothetical protein
LYNALYYACFVDETLALASAIKAGAEKVAGITRERYVNRLIWLRALSRFHIMMTRDDRQKTSFIRINNVLQNLRLDSADGTLRKQPYCIVLCGFPGCGKTATAIKIAETLIRSRHGKFYSTDVVTLNETDEFQSEYRTNHKVVIFDDVAADREKASSINPWRKIIDFVNNIRKTALNPNLELKGNVYIEPELIILTTNRAANNTFGISLHMKCTDAITRRFSEVLYLHNNYVDCTPMERYESSYPKSVGYVARNDDTYDEQRKYFAGDPISIEEKIAKMKIAFNEKMDEQEEFIQSINDRFEKSPLSENPILSFYHDVIRPLWFTKLNLPHDLEIQLPWYERLVRKFCVAQGKPIFMSQSIHSSQLLLEDSNVRDVHHNPTVETSTNIQNKPRFEFTTKTLRYPLCGFDCNPPRDDCFMLEFLQTIPPKVQLVLREWRNDCGVGDFVFHYKGKDGIPQFMVTEIKHNRFEIACAQSRKYGHEFWRLLNIQYKGPKKVAAVSITGDDYQVINIAGIGTKEISKMTNLIHNWHKRFQNRCKAEKQEEISTQLHTLVGLEPISEVFEMKTSEFGDITYYSNGNFIMPLTLTSCN